MGTRFGAERAEPEHVPEHRKNAFVPMFSVQWNTSKFSEHLDGYFMLLDINNIDLQLNCDY